MLVATTRKRADPAEMFGAGARPCPLRTSSSRSALERTADRRGAVAAAGARRRGHRVRDAQSRRHRAPEGARLVPPHLRAVPKRQVLVFIHGFNNRFDDAVFRFAQIVHDSDAPVVPILFTWPSRGSVLAMATTGRVPPIPAMPSRACCKRSRVIRRSAKSPSGPFHGQSARLETLRQMAIRDGRVTPKIVTSFWLHPMSMSISKEAIVDMGPRANRPAFTLFVSRDDRALAVSRRVGQRSPPGSHRSRSGALPDAARTSERDGPRPHQVCMGDALNHGKFAQSPEVVQLIGKRLAEGRR